MCAKSFKGWIGRTLSTKLGHILGYVVVKARPPKTSKYINPWTIFVYMARVTVESGVIVWGQASLLTYILKGTADTG